MRFSLASAFAANAALCLLLSLWQWNTTALLAGGPVVALILALWAEAAFKAGRSTPRHD